MQLTRTLKDHKMSYITVEAALVTVLLFLPIVRSADNVLIPSDKSQLNTWFKQNVGPLSSRKGSLDPELVAAENNVTVVHVNPNGSGDFKTVTDAVKSIPNDNKNRVIVSIAPGIYKEKVEINQYQHFVTLYGSDPNDMPTIVWGDTAADNGGTTESGSLKVSSNYFTMVNMIIKNSAPRPDGKRRDAQAVAFRISGDKASFYNCRFLGFQDTLLDDAGNHFYKDCYVEGTVDFIFGHAKSLFLNTEIHVIPGDAIAMISAHARRATDENTGYSFVHSTVTGKGQTALLGRAWFDSPLVVYSYSQLSDVVNPQGWSNNNNPKAIRTSFFGEYNNKGPGSNFNGRVAFAKKLSDAQAKPFISLAFIEASKWLLPPPQV